MSGAGGGAGRSVPLVSRQVGRRGGGPQQRRGLPIIRPSWVFGPGDRSLNRILSFGRFLPFIPVIGDGSKQRVQPVFVDDVARLAADSLERPEAKNQVLEIGGEQVVSMDELVRIAYDVQGKKPRIIHQPKRLMKMVGSVAASCPARR